MKLKLILSIGCCLLINFSGRSQTNAPKKYLENIGILDSIYSTTLKEYRRIYIQFPDNYTLQNDKKYPVAYILDGEVLLPTVKNVQSFYSGGFTPEMILVGISNEKHRTRDLTPSKITEKYGMPFNQENGQADNFTAFLEKELIPFIENKYPVTRFRTLIGHSYGGLFTINMLVNYPQLFSNYLAIDPSLDWDHQKLLKEAQAIVTNQNYENKALFMSLNGQLHMQNAQITIDNVMQDTTDFTVFARSNIAFSNLVKQHAENGLSFEWKFYPRDIHGTIALPSIMDGLISLFGWYQMENVDKFNSFDTPKDELFSIIKHREKKLKEHFGYSVPPYPEELLNMLGYMNMDMQQPEKAKMFFKLVIAYYPESANAYDSMAEYYERMGDNTKAIQFVSKAFELTHDARYKQKIEALKKQ